MNINESFTPANRAKAIADAHASGVDAAQASASWACDGNTPTEEITRRLRMLDDGDPAVWDALPTHPNLSGEMADDPTPSSLARDIVGEDVLDALSDDVRGDLVDALADAWEEGVSDTFGPACESELRKHLPDVEDTSEDRSTDHGLEVCPDCGNAGVKVDASGYVPCTRFLTCWADVDTETGDVNLRDDARCEACGMPRESDPDFCNACRAKMRDARARAEGDR